MPRPSRASSVRPPRPVLNALGQITPLGVAQWCQQPVVDRQQIQFGHAGEQPRIGAIATPDGQLMQQARQTDVGGREAAATRPYGAKKRPRLGRCWSSLLRNSWVHKFACFEVNEAQAESLCAVTEVAERPGAMLGLIGLDSRIGVVDVTS